MKTFALVDESSEPGIVDAAEPEPGPGEVRVRVRAASVNGFDLAVAGGYLWSMMPHTFPVVLGKDFAGEIDAVGQGVAGFAVGDRVFGVVAGPSLGQGSFGRYMTVPVALGVAHRPDGLDDVEAAALGLAGTAAIDSVDAAKLREGQTVLIVGATGGVGQLALQLAVRAKARVIATASSPDAVDLVTGLGATETVDHRADLTAQVAAMHPEGVDVVLHFAGVPDPLLALVKPGGTFVSTMLGGGSDLRPEGVEVVSIFATPSATTLERLAHDQVSGAIDVTVDRVYPLDDAARAFRDFAAGTRGKLVVVVD